MTADERRAPNRSLLLRGTGWVALAQGASKGTLLLTVVIAARLLDVTEFGFVMSLYAVVLVASVVWNLGTPAMISRDVASGELSLHLGTRSLVQTRVRSIPVWAAVFFIGASVVHIDHPEATSALLLFAFVSCAHNASTALEALLHSQLRFDRSAMAATFGRAIQVLCLPLFLLLLPDRPVTAISAAFLAGESAVALLLLRGVRGLPIEASDRDEHGVSTSVRRAVARALPYALSGFFKLGYGKADLILVTSLAGALQAGLYAPATRLQDALMLIPAIAIGTLVPLSARTVGAASSKDAESIFRHGLAVSLALSTTATVAAFILIPWVLPLVLGPGFEGAVAPARILIWSIPLAAAQASVLATLIAQGRASATTVIHGTALLVTLVAHLVLDRRYGAVGGAWASLVREPIALTVGFLLMRGSFRDASASPIPVEDLGRS